MDVACGEAQAGPTRAWAGDFAGATGYWRRETIVDASRVCVREKHALSFLLCEGTMKYVEGGCAFCGRAVTADGSAFAHGRYWCGSCEVSGPKPARTPEQIVAACKELAVRRVLELPAEDGDGAELIVSVAIELEFLFQEAGEHPGGRQQVLARWGEVTTAVDLAMSQRFPAFDPAFVALVAAVLDEDDQHAAALVAERGEHQLPEYPGVRSGLALTGMITAQGRSAPETQGGNPGAELVRAFNVWTPG